MKTIYSIAISSLMLVVLMSGNCSKDDTPPATKTEMISSSNWKFEKATAGGFDITAQVDACIKDNTISFSANGTGTIAEGPIVCIPPTASTFNWSFQTNETVLSLSTPLITGGSGNFNIVTLNQTNLVISQDMIIPPNPTAVTVVITFKH
jgi:lipocalin-like protein